ncbi:hypothetical protein G6F62_013362 [Rhizopus arrhizus]|nr:hypothetical protein G6F62_013362 [Rhizopus arrhizus]
MTSASPAPRGVYLITPDEPDTARLLVRTAPLLAAGATWLQYRNKTASDALRQEQATALQGLCAAHGVPLIINDDPLLAKAVGAAGVHLVDLDMPDLPAVNAAVGMPLCLYEQKPDLTAYLQRYGTGPFSTD